jgi:serine/threonine-protein kinase RsbW
VISVERLVPNDASGVDDIAHLLDELAAAHGLPAAAVTDMQVALDEVLSNIVRYAHADGRAHEIRVRLTLSPEVLEAEIEDDGRPFDPLGAPHPDLQSSLQDRAVGGLGIHFVRRLMTEVRYALVDNRNRLVLTKRLIDQREADPRGDS